MKILFTCVLVLVLTGILALSGCAASEGEGFAIYLTREDVPPAQMPASAQVALDPQPIIAINDIVTYNAKTHEIALTESCYERIIKLDVPVRGRSFVVCVDRKPIYWGAFWVLFSSISFDGVTIMKPLGSRDTTVVKLDLGYPTPSYYGSEDPRNSAEVIKSLEQAGKLK